MEDEQIVALFWERDENAIKQTQNKYGKYCFAIANNILSSRQDAEECVNDTYIGAWNAMPPHRPAILSTFLGKITRRLALKKWRSRTALKRGGGQTAAVLEEWESTLASVGRIDENLELGLLTETINDFLETLSVDVRRVFLRRYWYFDSVRSIAERFGYSESKVKMMLKRARDQLAVRLEKEEIRL